jgi:hypothetical protein
MRDEIEGRDGRRRSTPSREAVGVDVARLSRTPLLPCHMMRKGSTRRDAVE